MPERPLSPGERRRRVLIVCCNFVRSLAIYRSVMHKGETLLAKSYVDVVFWRQVASDAIDVCVLEWCKVFADPKWGKHHYTRIFSEKGQVDFLQRLFSEQNLTPVEYEAFVKNLRLYRDKFVAHLDDERIMYPPKFDIAFASISLLYSLLVEKECGPEEIAGFAKTRADFETEYNLCVQKTNAIIRRTIGE